MGAVVRQVNALLGMALSYLGTLGQGPAPVLTLRLLANVPRKVADCGSSMWVLVIHVGDPLEFQVCWLLLGSAPARGE